MSARMDKITESISSQLPAGRSQLAGHSVPMSFQLMKWALEKLSNQQSLFDHSLLKPIHVAHFLFLFHFLHCKIGNANLNCGHLIYMWYTIMAIKIQDELFEIMNFHLMIKSCIQVKKDVKSDQVCLLLLNNRTQYFRL